MSIEMRSFETGPLGVNCYILWDKETREGMVIDAGGNAQELLDFIASEKLKIQFIVNTHGHGDHIGANDALRDALRVPLLIHSADQVMLTDSRKNLSAFMGVPVVCRAAEENLQDGQEISFADAHFKILYTPGHSPGGVCLYGEGRLFSGDSLFAESVGRCDFPGASESQLIQALQAKVMILPDETRVYPGHGPATTIGWEHLHNPYLMNR